MTSIRDLLAERPAEERRDLEILIGHLIGRSRGWLYAHGDENLPEEAARCLDEWIARRHAGEPVAYLTGHREFWGLDLEVTPAVLVPRPETELLVELALARMPDHAEVLDLATGSGAIGLALAGARLDCRVTATDVDVDALALARRNAARLGIALEFARSDWYQALAGRTFHLIVSNPPYVASGDPHLAALSFEPASALVAGADGLDALRVVIAGAPTHLVRGGRLIVEHGYDQGGAVRALFWTAGFRDVATHRDLAGVERATLGTFQPAARDEP